MAINIEVALTSDENVPSGSPSSFAIAHDCIARVSPSDALPVAMAPTEETLSARLKVARCVPSLANVTANSMDFSELSTSPRVIDRAHAQISISAHNDSGAGSTACMTKLAHRLIRA
jgi:hypothetical protein